MAARSVGPTWINVRTLLGSALFFISLASGWVVLGAADRGSVVWAASRDLPEGKRLSAADLQPVEVSLPPDQIGLYLTGSRPLAGAALVRPVRRGELLPAGWVAEVTAPARSITIPLTADHAVGGELRPGDRVDVFATLQAGQPEARTIALVQGAEVEQLLLNQGFVSDVRTIEGITVAVSVDEAARIAFAVRSAEIDVVRVAGPVSAEAPYSVTARDL